MPKVMEPFMPKPEQTPITLSLAQSACTAEYLQIYLSGTNDSKPVVTATSLRRNFNFTFPPSLNTHTYCPKSTQQCWPLGQGVDF